MRLNQKGIDFIKDFEQLRLIPYRDEGGKLTIGYGHLIKEDEKHLLENITKAAAEDILKKDIAFAENAVNRLVSYTLNTNQFAALVSLAFNIGEGNFTTSTLLKKLNAGDPGYVPGEILKWHFVEKKPSRGLIKRRATEAQLFLS